MVLKAQEVEKVGIITELDEMNDEERKIELMKKRLGLGRWAIGGTKLIWAYDRDQYDREREARLGNYDALGETREGVEALGRENDANGLLDFGADYNNSGYDYALHDQDEE
jgi:hypothetical protein